MNDIQNETNDQDNEEVDVVAVLGMNATRDDLIKIITFAAELAPVETLEDLGKEIENNMMGTIADSFNALSELTTQVDEESINAEDAQKKITEILVTHCELIDLHTGIMSVIVTALHSRVPQDSTTEEDNNDSGE